CRSVQVWLAAKIGAAGMATDETPTREIAPIHHRMMVSPPISDHVTSCSCKNRSLRLLVSQHKLVDRCWRAKNNNVAFVLRMPQEIALGDKLESGRFNFFAQRAFLYPMESFPDRRSVPGIRRVIGNQKIATRFESPKQLAVHLRAINIHICDIVISEKESDKIKIVYVRRYRIVVVTNDVNDTLHHRLLGAKVELVLDLPLYYLG